MYFWKINNLIADLKEDKISAQQEMWYLFIFIFVAGLAVFAGNFTELEDLKQSKVIDSFSIVIGCGGVVFCYWANKEFDSKDFIKRFICLSLPVSIQFIVYFLIFIIAALVVFEIFFGGVPSWVETKYIDGVRGGIIIEALYYVFLYHSFKDFQPEPEVVENVTQGRKEKNCPYCAESILLEAKLCKHCGQTV
ncbi:MAG: hypothetical protein JKY59_08700 [Emcibacter sp.]|nr:hypothetical protein [Emcibacter sp.]